ncbi:alkene reductase [Chitinophagaceae bacterium MMS25-I14]
MQTLFSPFNLAGLELPNRIIMPPMTRVRAPQDVATEQMALYYAQRATAGLIIAEGSPISNEGQGYLFNPGIFTTEQIAGWRLVTDSVKSAGGRIFLQLWHVGRISHTSIQQDGRAPVSSTARRAVNSNAFAYDEQGQPGFVRSSAPRALETEEIPRIINDFVSAARNAMEAGFDGVEIHAANGYLFDQFINPLINDRTDQYGAATMENRLRFLLEIVGTISSEIGANKLGVRLSPYGILNDCPHFEDMEETYLEIGRALGKREVAFIHVMDQTGFFTMPQGVVPYSEAIKRLFRKWRPDLPKTALLFDGSMTKAKAEKLIGEGIIDLAGFGQPFIANPDLVYRFRHGLPLTVPDKKTYYTGGAKGYIDYRPFRPKSLYRAGRK